MKILITGVAGLLGSHFSRYLLDNGYEVVGIDNLSGGYKEFIDERVIFYNEDLINHKKVDEIFEQEKPQIVYHFSAYASEGLSPFIRRFNYINNIICSMNIINPCINHNVDKMVFTSSMAVYGSGIPPFIESGGLKPEDPYGIAKMAVETDLKLAYKLLNLRYGIIRPHNVVGIYQNIWDRYRNVIGIWINNTLNKKPILIYGDGEQKRAFSDIKYSVEPFLKIGMIDKDESIYNIGSDKEYTLNETADIFSNVAKEHGYDVNINHVETRDEVKLAYSDHTRAKTELDFNDETDLRSVISDMFVWSMTQPEREVKDMEYEVDKNIYSYWK